jgi:hypothetical protein
MHVLARLCIKGGRVVCEVECWDAVRHETLLSRDIRSWILLLLFFAGSHGVWFPDYSDRTIDIVIRNHNPDPKVYADSTFQVSRVHYRTPPIHLFHLPFNREFNYAENWLTRTAFLCSNWHIDLAKKKRLRLSGVSVICNSRKPTKKVDQGGAFAQRR